MYKDTKRPPPPQTYGKTMTEEILEGIKEQNEKIEELNNKIDKVLEYLGIGDKTLYKPRIGI